MGKRGILIDFVWSCASDMGHVAIRDSDTGQLELIPCQNIPGIKALRRAFAKGSGRYKGRQVLYQVDSLGLLASFRFVG
jgi:hypothetical protein